MTRNLGFKSDMVEEINDETCSRYLFKLDWLVKNKKGNKI